MANKQNRHSKFQQRMNKARSIVNFDGVKIIKSDKDKRVLNAYVPGSDAKNYEVIFRRDGRNYIETECLLQTGVGPQECPGGWNSVCYHAVAALLQSSKNNELDSAICQTEEFAHMRKNIGGQVFKVQSKYSSGNPVWFVVNYKPGQEPTEKPVEKVEKPKKTEAELLKELGYD